MKYKHIEKGIFLSRPNRFIAEVEIEGVQHTVHVKNTGRCKELLMKGATVFLEKSDNSDRKTMYDLVAVIKETGNCKRLINMDSQIVNDVAGEWLVKSGIFSDKVIIKREVTYGKSRFDFYVEDGDRKAFLEVKGVTLEKEGTAYFPDAPTERGVKHLNELARCIDDGYEAYVLFVIQMKGVSVFKPNDVMHKAFGDALRNAKNKGVTIFAVDCNVTKSSIDADCFVEVEL